jgi:hypothetical protein
MPRVVDVDAATMAVWRAPRKARGSMALQLAPDDAPSWLAGGRGWGQ